jgi:flagellar motor component MotA
MFVIIGFVTVIASVLIGFLASGGKLLLLWHPFEVVLICGSALGAFIASNPVKIIKNTGTDIVALFKKPVYDREAYLDLLRLLNDLLNKLRKEGVMGIEADCERPTDSAIFKRYPKILADHHMMEFICDCLRLMVGGNLDPHELESLLEYELETHHKEAHEPAHAVQQVADALPGFGIVAAVLGIVNTMAALDGAGHGRRSATRSAPRSSARSSASWSPTASSARSPSRSSIAHTRKARRSKWSRWRSSPACAAIRRRSRSSSRASCCSATGPPDFADLENQLKAKPRRGPVRRLTWRQARRRRKADPSSSSARRSSRPATTAAPGRWRMPTSSPR